MKPGRGIGRWRALLFGAALAMSPAPIFAAPPGPAPDGFVWEELKAVGVYMLRPEKWIFRCVIPASPFYECSPQPFTGPIGIEKGVGVHVMQRTDEPADAMAAARIAQLASGHKVLRGWTRKDVPAEPFTTYGLVCEIQDEEMNGIRCTCEFVLVANRVTNTVYQCFLVAPVAEWKDVETPGENMLAHLRLDPKF